MASCCLWLRQLQQPKLPQPQLQTLRRGPLRRSCRRLLAGGLLAVLALELQANYLPFGIFERFDEDRVLALERPAKEFFGQGIFDALFDGAA